MYKNYANAPTVLLFTYTAYLVSFGEEEFLNGNAAVIPIFQSALTFFLSVIFICYCPRVLQLSSDLLSLLK